MKIIRVRGTRSGELGDVSRKGWATWRWVVLGKIVEEGVLFGSEWNATVMKEREGVTKGVPTGLGIEGKGDHIFVAVVEGAQRRVAAEMNGTDI